MCLKTVDFALEFDTKGKFYYGTGYKVLLSIVQSAGGQDVHTAKYYSRWQKAARRGQSLTDAEKYGNTKISSYNYKRYPAGFHIFLKEDHAKQYSYGTVYKVMYRNVIAFGKNEYNTDSSGPCVIAKEMKIIGKV